jgi:hypothetical protein
MGKVTEAQFYDLKIASVKQFHQTVQINAYENAKTDERFPCCFKFIYKGIYADQMMSKFKKGDIVNIKARPEAYCGRVYGKLGKPIHYPNGKIRMTTKIQFIILNIKATW